MKITWETVLCHIVCWPPLLVLVILMWNQIPNSELIVR